MSLCGALDLVTAPLARAASAFVAAQGWAVMGYARLEDHARERFRRSGRWVRDLAALGRMFSTLPDLEAAVCGTDGAKPLGRVAGLLVGSVATPDTLHAWVERARSLTVRELKREVAEARAAVPAGSASGPVEPETRSLVRFLLPAPVRAAFEEALDLFRAVEGREATVTSFVEALTAEAASSGRLEERPADAFREALKPGRAVEAREEAFARSTNRWEDLPLPSPTEWALHLAGASLEKLGAASAVAGGGGPVELDRQIRELLEFEGEIERRLAALMAQMADDGAWSRLRFDSAVHYAEQRLGMRRSASRLRVRVARALRRLPSLREAYERGEVGMEAAWLVYRMMGSDPVDAAARGAWMDRARLATVKRLRDELRLTGWMEAGLDTEPQDCGVPSRKPISDAAWHASLERDAGTARRRLAALGRLAAQRRGSDVFLALRLPDCLARDFLDAVESARRDLERRVEEETGDDPPGSLLAARRFAERRRRAPAWIGLLALVEEFVATWDVEQTRTRRSRRAVFIRGGWRCAAPGCTSRRNLEEHHITYRSRGGGDAPDNRLPLCRFHHQLGEHGGLATCRGTAPLGVTWTLGRQGCAGKFRNEIRA